MDKIHYRICFNNTIKILILSKLKLKEEYYRLKEEEILSRIKVQKYKIIFITLFQK